MQHSVLTRQSGHTVHPDKVCLTVSCVYTHPVQGFASPRTLDYNKSMVDSLSGAESVFLPDKWLIDSGSDINICYNYELFSYIGPSDIEQCTPLGSTPLPVQGKGVVKMCVGNYMDHNGLNHPVDLEIENVYEVPYSSIMSWLRLRSIRRIIFYSLVHAEMN